MFFILLGFDDNKLLLIYFYIFKLCLGRALQRYIHNDNPALVSDMVSKNMKCASNFWMDNSRGFHPANDYILPIRSVINVSFSFIL